MTAITISRQLGSLGDEVAQAVAQRLNFDIFSRELISQAALRAGVPEVALAAIDDLGLLGIRPSSKARHAYHRAMQSIMEELAARGDAIIIGRAGHVILWERPDVMHIKVIAPVSLRAERIASQQNISLMAARAQIETSDRYRRNYLRRYYNVRWDDPERFDLVINTARLTPEQAACHICQALTQCTSPTTYANQESQSG